jgi:ATP-dependent DNA helicase RecQ
VLHDSTLRALARVRPVDEQNLRQVPGIGEKRLAEFGAALVELIGTYCREQSLPVDQMESVPTPEFIKPKSASPAKQQAYDYFRRGWSVDDVKHKLNRARSTIAGYLAEFIADEKPPRIKCWVADSVYRSVAQAAAGAEDARLSPIFQKLDGRVPFDTIRLVLAHMQAVGLDATENLGPTKSVEPR